MIEGSCGAPGQANKSKSQVKGNFGLWRPASWPKAGIDITLGDMRNRLQRGPDLRDALKGLKRFDRSKWSASRSASTRASSGAMRRSRCGSNLKLCVKRG